MIAATAAAALAAGCGESDRDAGAPRPAAEGGPAGSGGGPAGTGGAGGVPASGAAGTAGPCGVEIGPGSHPIDLVSSGRPRTARIHVPPAYEPGVPAMLVLAFHGWTQSGARLEEISRLSEKSDRHGFLVVYPEGLSASWNAGGCCGAPPGEGNDDVLFARDLVARVQAEYCIDARRVYATGFSNGAMMSHRIACEAADLFAAIAPVSGQIAVSSCAPSRPIPVWTSQGTSDLILQLNGLGSFAETVAGWVERNACTDASPVETYQNGGATCLAHVECGPGAVVEWCELAGAGHQWPGGVSTGPIGGAISNDLDASEALYRFFAAHPMP